MQLCRAVGVVAERSHPGPPSVLPPIPSPAPSSHPVRAAGSSCRVCSTLETPAGQRWGGGCRYAREMPSLPWLQQPVLPPPLCQDEKEQLIQSKSSVASLVGRSKTIVQLRPRNPEHLVKSTIPIKAVCDYRQIEVSAGSAWEGKAGTRWRRNPRGGVGRAPWCLSLGSREWEDRRREIAWLVFPEQISMSQIYSAHELKSFFLRTGFSSLNQISAVNSLSLPLQT